jgi:hypothetical protein
LGLRRPGLSRIREHLLQVADVLHEGGEAPVVVLLNLVVERNAPLWWRT